MEINHCYLPEWLDLKTDQKLTILCVHKEVGQTDLSYTTGVSGNWDNTLVNHLAGDIIAEHIHTL